MAARTAPDCDHDVSFFGGENAAGYLISSVERQDNSRADAEPATIDSPWRCTSNGRRSNGGRVSIKSSAPPSAKSGGPFSLVFHRREMIRRNARQSVGSCRLNRTGILGSSSPSSVLLSAAFCPRQTAPHSNFQLSPSAAPSSPAPHLADLTDFDIFVRMLRVASSTRRPLCSRRTCGMSLLVTSAVSANSKDKK